MCDYSILMQVASEAGAGLDFCRPAQRVWRWGTLNKVLFVKRTQFDFDVNCCSKVGYVKLRPKTNGEIPRLSRTNEGLKVFISHELGVKTVFRGSLRGEIDCWVAPTTPKL